MEATSGARAGVYVPRSLLHDAAVLCGYPSVRLPSGFEIPDEAVWRHALDRAAWTDRWLLLQSLEGPLMRATDEGSYRIDHVSDGAPPEPLCFGDEDLLPLLRAAISLVPRPVKFAMAEAAWLGVGFRTRAWTAGANFVGADGVARSRVVVAGPRADITSLVHEGVHLFHGPKPEAAARLNTVCVQDAIALDQIDRWKTACDAYTRTQELLAEALVLLWTGGRADGGAPA